MKTFIDAGTLIAAYRGEKALRKRALDLLDSPGRELVTSDFVRLEVLPKAVYNKRQDEVSFYEAFFKSATTVEVSEKLVHAALSEAEIYGLNAVDALHVAAAKASECAEFHTTEGNEKPVFRVAGMKIVSLQ